MSTVKSVRFEDNVIEISNDVLDFLNNGWMPSPKVSFSSLLNEGLIEVMWNKIYGYLPYCETSPHRRKFPIIDRNGNLRLIEPSDEERNQIFDLAKKILEIKILNDCRNEEEQISLVENNFDKYVEEQLLDYFGNACREYDDHYPTDDDVVYDYLSCNDGRKNEEYE